MPPAILGQRFESRAESAWHNLGNVFPETEHVTIEEATDRVAGDILFKKAPLFYFDNDAAKAVRLDDRFVVLRKPTPDDPEMRQIGTVGKNWKVQQYPDYAKAMNSLSDDYPVETAGVLGVGEHMFMALRGPDMGLKGPGGFEDPIRNYFVVELNQSPGNSHHVLHTPVRVVCSNTLSMAKGQANINIRVPHTGDPARTIKFVADIVGKFRQREEKSREIFEAFMGRVLNPDEFAQIVARTFPRPTKPRKVRMLDSMSDDQRAALMADAKQRLQLESYIAAEESWKVGIERTDRLRKVMRDLAERFNDQHPAVANTAWMAYNAATELADWREGREQSIGSSVLFGARMQEKVRAFDSCLELVKN